MRDCLLILLIVIFSSLGTRASETESGQLQATHMGYYDDGNFTWYLYFNDNEYYAKCYLGASTVTAPEWVSAVTTIQATVKSSTYALPTVFVFEDAPSTASTYTYSKTVNSITETHNLSYTVEDAGPMATVYNITQDKGTDLSAYNESNPLVLTVPDQVTLTLNDGTGTTISNVNITRLGSAQFSSDYYYHIGDALNALGVPVKLKLGANIQVIMANAFRVNQRTDENYLTGCTNLYGFDFNNNTSLWYIGKGAFMGASNLKLYPISSDDDHAVAVPTSLTQLQDSAFANSGIRSLVVTHAITNLGNNVFMNCDNMEYVTFRNLDFGSDTPADMLLSRDIETFKTNLKNSGTEVTTSTVLAKYQRLIDGIPTHVLVYAPKKFTKSYTYLDTSEGGYNIITSGDQLDDGTYISHCNHFYVYDNTSITGTNNAKGSYDYWVPHAFYADVCDYNRSFPTGWVTTYLPFDWKLPSGCTAYQASDNLLSTNSEGKTVFSFTEVSSTAGTTMTANTPYLLYNNSGSNVTLAQVTTDSPGLLVPVSPHPSMKTFLSSDAASKAIFWGSTEDIANDSAAVNYQAYNIRSDQTWGKVRTSNTAGYIGHFRSFVSDARTTSSAAKAYTVEMTINKPGETTSITTVDANALLSGNEPIYSLDGKYMGTDFTNLPNGVYIKKGKKFTVHTR